MDRHQCPHVASFNTGVYVPSFVKDAHSFGFGFFFFLVGCFVVVVCLFWVCVFKKFVFILS